MKSFRSLLTELNKPSALNYIRSQPITPDINVQFIDWFRANTKLMSDVMKFIQQSDGRFRTAGSGAYGKVFSSPDYPFVIKVFVTNSPTQGYLKWLEFCYRNQSNPYVPKIRGKHVMIGKGHNLAAVRIEKLLPLPRDKMIEFQQMLWDLDQGVGRNEHLEQILTYVNAQGPNDIGHDNIMMRSNGEIVIIDPIAG